MAAALAILTGCTVANYGTTAARVTHADGALIVDVFAVGGQLRTRSDDPGLSLGFARQSYVFPLPEPTAPAPGWYYFHVPLPDRPAVALDLRTAGLDVQTMRSSFGFTLGYRASTVLARVQSDRDMVLQIHYVPSDPKVTVLLYCEGTLECLAKN